MLFSAGFISHRPAWILDNRTCICICLFVLWMMYACQWSDLPADGAAIPVVSTDPCDDLSNLYMVSCVSCCCLPPAIISSRNSKDSPFHLPPRTSNPLLPAVRTAFPVHCFSLPHSQGMAPPPPEDLESPYVEPSALRAAGHISPPKRSDSPTKAPGIVPAQATRSSPPAATAKPPDSPTTTVAPRAESVSWRQR